MICVNRVCLCGNKLYVVVRRMAQGVEWYLNHIHGINDAEVINVISALEIVVEICVCMF